MVGSRDVHPSRANATTLGVNAVVEVVWGPPCGIVTHTGLGPPLAEAFLDWMRRLSVGPRAVMGMIDGVKSSRASLAVNPCVSVTDGIWMGRTRGRQDRFIKDFPIEGIMLIKRS
jgi:hypothetical protein